MKLYHFYLDYLLKANLVYINSWIMVKEPREYLLHELAHATLLGMGEHEWLHIEDWVSASLESMPEEESDRNEIESCAVELRAAKLIGLYVGSAEYIFTEVDSVPTAKAVSTINRMVWTEKTYKNAMKLLKSLEKTCEAHIEASHSFHPFYGYRIR